MHQVIEALIDEMGRVFLSEPVRLPHSRRALVIILEEETASGAPAPRTDIPAVSTPAVGTPHVGFPAVGTAALLGAAAFVSELPRDDPQHHYSIGSPLETGSRGQTFIGTDRRTGETVRIRRLGPGVGSESLREQWPALAQVEGRHVVRVLDRFEQDGDQYLVLEQIEGRTLADLLAAGLPPAEATWLALGLLRGISAFHKLGITHCDLSPENVLIRQEFAEAPGEPGWVPKILGFGLASLDRPATGSQNGAVGQPTGTPAYLAPAYLAPEQVNGWRLSPACDIYAAGLMVYEAITGRPAFAGLGPSVMMAKLSQSTGLRIGRLPAGVPAVLGELVERCTDPHPTRRPTAAECLDRLEQCLTSDVCP